MKTERMVILVTPEQKRAITQRAKTLKLSTGEIVRRAMESYRPGNDDALLNALADELEKSSKQARKALREAHAELGKTLDYFAAKRSPKRKAA
ncbi:MAG: hypothetical protein Q7U07_01185 [Gammaproteobacteria bacterium]|nr:hypothetical protein [Gammaproteobacteria bacterium]